MDVQTLRAEAFKALHEREGAFVIPNPWDAGTARLLASLGETERSNQLFQVYARPNGLTHARLGLVVGKKVAKRANRRNYIKRTVREWFRLHRHDLPPMDFVVRSRQAYYRGEYHEAVKALAALFAKLARCRDSSSS